MDSFGRVFIPTMKPPKSEALFKASFAQRVSQHLLVHNRQEYPLHPGPSSQPVKRFQPSSVASRVNPSTIDLFGGDLRYSVPVNNATKPNVKRPISGDGSNRERVECKNSDRKRQLVLSSGTPKNLPTAESCAGAKRQKKSVAISELPKKVKQPPTSTVCRSSEQASNHFPLSVEGIELFCRNIGASIEALDTFSEMCSAATSFSFAFVYVDGTTSHAKTSFKLCVPSKPCKQWHCSCDRHIRARHGTTPLLGAAICLEGQEEYIYFLSLSSKMDNMINCQSSLEQRWDTFFDILWGKACEKDGSNSTVSHKILFNLQLLMHSVFHKLKLSHQNLCHCISNNNSNLFDIKIASHLCDSNLSDEELELRAISDRCCASFPIKNHSYEQSMGSVTKILHNLHGELQLLLGIHNHLETDLKQKRLQDCFHQIEIPIAMQLSRMEIDGISVVSASGMNDMQHQLQSYVATLEVKAADLLKEKSFTGYLNMSSPEQVANVLFSVLKLRHPSNDINIPSVTSAQQTKGGKHKSTSEEDLLRIVDQHPLVQVILSHRHVSKVLHTFIEGMQTFIADDFQEDCASTRRLYASWNQTSTRTGRLSCQKPNLQAFPNPKRAHSLLKEVGIDTNVRSLFTASSGGVLVSADYSQIEMRVLAHMCGDKGMTELFNCTSGDIYETLARIILNKKDADTVSSVERERAKVICLGTIYGMGLPAAASKLNISLQVAHSIVNSFYSKFKNVKMWIQFIKSDAREKGYVSTITGRKRYLPDIVSTDTKKRSQAQRQAVNSVIQGSASDVIKYAMLSVERKIDQHPLFGYPSSVAHQQLSIRVQRNPLRPSIISQIHDEVIYDLARHTKYTGGSDVNVSDDYYVQQFVTLLREGLEESTRIGLGIKVPLLVKIAIGPNWGNMVPYDGDSQQVRNSAISSTFVREKAPDQPTPSQGPTDLKCDGVISPIIAASDEDVVSTISTPNDGNGDHAEEGSILLTGYQSPCNGKNKGRSID